MRGDQARWSDDGRAIYTRNADSTGTSFWRIPLDGGAPERLVTFEGGQRSSGGWGAAAGRLAYARSEERSDVWVMEVRTPVASRWNRGLPAYLPLMRGVFRRSTT